MFELLKKTFEIKIWTQKIKYEQASYYETMEFLYDKQKESFNINIWALDFLKENWFDLEKFEKESNKKFKEKSKYDFNEFMALVILPKYIPTILTTRFKWYFSTWDNPKKPKIITHGEKTPTIQEAYYAGLASHFNTDILTVLKSYTFEAIQYLERWIQFNNNNYTKEWKELNKINVRNIEVANDPEIIQKAKEHEEFKKKSQEAFVKNLVAKFEKNKK